MVALRILVADDHAAVRRSIRSLLESHPKWKVCGEATNGREAVEEARQLKPDVVLLDLTMPEVDGLEATRQILKEASHTEVLVLSMHLSDELTDEVRRAGARGVVSKSDAHDLIAAIEALQGDGLTIHLAGSVVGSSRHVGAFFQSEKERYRVLGPFVAEGLANGERAFHIIEPPGRDLHLRRLMEAGIDVDRATSRRQLELVPWEAMYLRDGHFDQQAMIKRIEGVLADPSPQGFPLTRLVANMEWALERRSGVGDLVEYETRLNYALPRFEDVVICAYDLTMFPGSTIVDVLRSHPAVVIGGSLRDNPFYMLPDLMIEELRHGSA